MCVFTVQWEYMGVLKGLGGYWVRGYVCDHHMHFQERTMY